MRTLAVGCFLVAVVLFSSPAIAGCIDYGDYLRWVGSMSTSGAASDVAICGASACVTIAGSFGHPAGIQLVDISDPLSPRAVAALDLPGAASRVAVSSTHAFVADGAPGLQVIDLSMCQQSPPKLSVVGNIHLPNNLVTDVVVRGAFAYMVRSCYGLDVVDITNPTSPVIVGTDEINTPVKRVVVEGDFAYLVGMGAGLKIIDIADPEDPHLVGSVSLVAGSDCVDVEGNFAYVGSGSGLQVVYIGNPLAPMLVGHIDTAPLCDVVARGNLVYAIGYGQLNVIDVAHPSAMQILGNVNLGGSGGVAIVDDLAYIAAFSRGLAVINIENAQSVACLCNLFIGNSQEVHEVAVAGPYAYVANDAGGLQVVGVADPLNPLIVATVDTPGSAVSVAVSKGHAYVADGSAGLQVVDIDATRPGRPVIVASVGTLNAVSVAVSGDYAYALGEPAILQVIEIENPRKPRTVGTLLLPTPADRIAVSGSYAYLGGRGSGILRVVDVSDPEHPWVVSSLDMPGAVLGIAVSGAYAYVADSDLDIIDIADPMDPRIVSHVSMDCAQGVAVSGMSAYVVDRQGCLDWDGDLQVFDITNPRCPELVGNAPIWFPPHAVVVANGYAFVASTYSLQVVPAQCQLRAEGVERPGSSPDWSMHISPNPILRRTVIRLDLPVSSRVSVSIHDAVGRRVRDLHEGTWSAGTHELLWDGRDEEGCAVAAGVYWSRISTPADVRTERVVVVR